MAKRPSSSSAGAPAEKKVKLTSTVVTKKKAVATPSGKKNGKGEPKVGSSGRKSDQSAAIASSSQASTSKANTSKASTSKPSTSNVSTSKASASKARASKAKPVIIDEETKRLQAEAYDQELDEYTVERILDKRIPALTGVIEYLVKWLGYSKAESTWETVHHLANSMKHVLLWERSHGKNWKLVPIKTKQGVVLPYANAMRNLEIRSEYARLTKGGYRVKEKYGSANGQTWLLMALGEEGEEQVEKVLCIPDDDPYFQKMNIKEYVRATTAGAWDNLPEEEAPVEKTSKKKHTKRHAQKA